MKHTTSHLVSKLLCGALALSLLLPGLAHAQGTISKEEYSARQKGLLAAIAAMEAEEARQLAADKVRQKAQVETAEQDAARDALLRESPRLAADSASVAKAKSEIAAREARVRKDMPASIVAMLDVGTPAGGVPVEGNGPAPGAKPMSVAEREASREKKKGEDKEVEIFAQGGCTFNSKANLVVFERDVVVNHPQFDLVCDKLIVFLKKQAAEGESALSKAIATGKRVTVRQVNAEGEVQIGQARKVTFEGDSGNVILQDWPQVQTGNRLIQAKEQGTVIILNQDGQMKITGPSLTKLILPQNMDKQAGKKDDDE
ncbi:MAG: lipopolysaccharide transport protein LptA [Verrucomicrobiales bacterium]|jgi:lipopolysaccharide transport protein LptA